MLTGFPHLHSFFNIIFKKWDALRMVVTINAHRYLETFFLNSRIYQFITMGHSHIIRNPFYSKLMLTIITTHIGPKRPTIGRFCHSIGFTQPLQRFIIITLRRRWSHTSIKNESIERSHLQNRKMVPTTTLSPYLYANK